MYYDRNDNAFKCYQKIGTNPDGSAKFGWQNCGGGGGFPNLTVPVRIYDSANRVVLEINQE